MNRQIIRRDLTIVTVLALVATIGCYFADQPAAGGIAFGLAIGVEITRWRLARAERKKLDRLRIRPNAPWVTYTEHGRPEILESVTYDPPIATTVIKGGQRRRWWRLWQIPVAALFVVPAVVILAAPKSVAADYTGEDPEPVCTIYVDGGLP